MGTFSVTIGVGDIQGRRHETLEALVGTGASYLVVPRSILAALAVAVAEQRPFTLADGRQALYDAGVASLSLEGRSFPVLTVFGQDGASALLGAVALETFGLAVDPIHKRLVPASGLMMTCRR